VDIDPSLYLDNLRRELVSRKYGQKTLKAYLYYNEAILGFAGKNPESISNSDVRDYLVHLIEQRNASASTLNIAINALRFYYGNVLKRDFVYETRKFLHSKNFDWDRVALAGFPSHTTWHTGPYQGGSVG
jgi:integrase/recombinase XerD